MQSEFSDIEQRTRAFDQERQAIGLSAEAATKAKAAFRLLEAAKHAGIPITEELKAKVDQLATSYAAASTRLDEAQKRQETYQQLNGELGSSLADAFKGAVLQSENLKQVMLNLINTLASKGIDELFKELFQTSSGGGIAGYIGSILGFADGGYVRGPGTARSDSIPAWLSNKKFVVNAQATAKHRPLLEAIK